MNIEKKRLELQDNIDKQKSRQERNKLGQFATDPRLANDIVKYTRTLLGKNKISFLEPSIGTGAFFSALSSQVSPKDFESALGYEIDPEYFLAAKNLWEKTCLKVHNRDFTKEDLPELDSKRYNLIISNPPYIRHHHLTTLEKDRLRSKSQLASNVSINGLAGMYCHFLLIAHSWLKADGIGVWLIPNEFMDVNYGKSVKEYLLDKVDLIRIHRFNPSNLQFQDALVSSTVIWFRKAKTSKNETVEFTFGSSIILPEKRKLIAKDELKVTQKWSTLTREKERDLSESLKLSDIFDIKRGIATGNNAFFILTEEQVSQYGLSMKFLKPILPSSRFLTSNEILSDTEGNPLISKKHYLLDCNVSEEEIESSYPGLWKYLQEGKEIVSKGYLCKSRKKWYFQESRRPAPILCTYIGRSDGGSESPFKFILNHSKAIATNSYLMLYPKASIAMPENSGKLRSIWKFLNQLSTQDLIDEGRVYGGGMHKLEPKELANVKLKNFVL